MARASQTPEVLRASVASDAVTTGEKELRKLAYQCVVDHVLLHELSGPGMRNTANFVRLAAQLGEDAARRAWSAAMHEYLNVLVVNLVDAFGTVRTVRD